jgi:hypothetical protein
VNIQDIIPESVSMNRLAVMETFVRVVETGSFSAAAKHSNIGQPAVSKSIARCARRAIEEADEPISRPAARMRAY